jgi:hypothetical protein
MSVIIDGGAGVTFPDAVQQTNGVTNTGGDPRYYAARAWFNTSGGVSPGILAQANISSVSRLSTGLYSFTFATPMQDAFYVVLATARNSNTIGFYMVTRIASTPTASSFQIVVSNQSGGSPVAVDPDNIHVAVFR